MPDREKIIYALKRCDLYEMCVDDSCPYYREADCLEKLRQDALALLKEQPEIARCKDCFYADDFDCPAPLPTGYLCQKGHGSHMGDWFCADGERQKGR